MGYVIGNIVLACTRCNSVKNGYLTYEQMKEVAQKYFMNETAALAAAKGGE